MKKSFVAISILLSPVLVFGQSNYFSTRTGLTTSSPQPSDAWTVFEKTDQQVSPYHPEVIIRTDASGYRLSTDGGSTFRQLSKPFASPAVFLFDLVEPNLLLASTEAEAAVSFDQGSSWSPLQLPSGSAGRILLAEWNTGEPKLLFARGSQIWETTISQPFAGWNFSLDAGSAVTNLQTGPTQSLIVGGTAEGAIYIRNNYGNRDGWVRTAVYSGAVSRLAFDPLDDQHFAAGFQVADSSEPNLFSTTNGGLTFLAAYGFPRGPILDLLFVVGADNLSRLYAVSNQLLVSTDLFKWSLESGLAGKRVDGIQQIRKDGTLVLSATSEDAVYEVPSAGGCVVAVTPPSASVPAAGGAVEFRIDVQPGECGWAATQVSLGPVHLSGPFSGTGNSTSSATMDLTSASQPRRAYFYVGGQLVPFDQEAQAAPSMNSHFTAAQEVPGASANATAASCAVTYLKPNPIGKAGGKEYITFRKTSACGPVSIDTNSPSWIRREGLEQVITDTAQITVVMDIDDNLGTARTGLVYFKTSSGKVTGSPARISQDAGSSCDGITAILSPVRFDYTGGSGTLTLKPSGPCRNVGARSNVSFITLKSTGTYTYSVRVAANPGFQRDGIITISATGRADLSEPVPQNGVPTGVGGPGPPPSTGCLGIRASLSPTTYAIGGGTGTLSIIPSGTCVYGVSADFWITARQSSTANKYTVSVASNVGNSARHGTIQVTTSGGAYKSQVSLDESGVQPAAGCTGLDLTLAPSSFSSAPAAGTLTVVPSGNCMPMNGSSDSSWAQVTSKGTNGYLVNVQANTSTQSRTAKITVHASGGTGFTKTISLTQAGSGTQPQCAISVSPTSLSFGGGGGALPIKISANLPTCSFTTGPILTTFPGGNGWLHLDRTQGTGSQTILVSVDSDATSIIINNIQGRSATITINGIVVAVHQDPPIPISSGCSPLAGAGGANIQMGINTNPIQAAGGSAVITVLAPSNCDWILNSDAPFLKFTNGNQGTGNGTVPIILAPNTDLGPRVAHITSPQAVAGLDGHAASVTITQLGTK